MAVSVSHSLPVKKLFFPLGSLSAWRTVNPALESRDNHVLNQSKLLAVKIMSDFGDCTLRFQHRKL